MKKDSKTRSHKLAFANFCGFHRMSQYFQLKVLDELLTDISSPSHFTQRVEVCRCLSVSSFIFSLFLLSQLNVFIPFFQILIQLALPSLYDTWDDLLSTRDVTFLVDIFEPFVELMLHDLGTTFKNFLCTFEELHKTAAKGSSHHTFSSKEEKLLIKKFQISAKKGEPCPELLSEISSIALQKCKQVWLETYHDTIYMRLLVHLGDLYGVDVDGLESFANSFPLKKKPKYTAAPFCPDASVSKNKLSKADKSINAQVGQLNKC